MSTQSGSASLSPSADRVEESSVAAAEKLCQEQAAAYNVQLDLELYLRKSHDLVEHLKETGAECLRAPAFATASSGSDSASASNDSPGAAAKSKRGSPQKHKPGNRSARLHKQSAPSLQAATLVTSAEALCSITCTDSPDNAQPPAGAATSGASPSGPPAESTDCQATSPTECSSPPSGDALVTVLKPSHRMLPNFALNHVVLVEKCARVAYAFFLSIRDFLISRS